MEDTLYLPLDQQALTNEASKRRSLLITSTTLALLLVLSIFWHPSALPPLQSCPTAVLPMPPSVVVPPPSPSAAAIISNTTSQQNSNNISTTTSTTTTTTRTFRQTRIYSNLSTKADALWTALIPPNGGFVPHINAQGGRELAGVSMFHQLHCLQMMRTAMQDMRAGRRPMLEQEAAAKHDDEQEENGSANNHGNELRTGQHGRRQQRSSEQRREDNQGIHRHQKKVPEKEEEEEEEHWVHCLDYLVQAVLCSADDTIEPAYVAPDGGLVIDGYDIQHQCKDPNRLWTQATTTTTTPGEERSRPGWDMVGLLENQSR